MYPVMLNVKDRRCLVVGGGGVALRKVEGLIADGARVNVVAPDPVEALSALADRGAITMERRSYWPGEVRGYFLAFAATDSREVNRKVFEDGGAAGVWVNVADDPDLCTFHLPARMRRGALQLSVASAGEAPFVVRRMRQLLEKRFGPEWAEWVDAAARFRQRVRRLGMESEDQERLFDLFFDCTVDAKSLRARVPTEGEESGWLSRESASCGEEVPPGPREPPRAVQPAGFVSLVGAGPGDAGLLTVRGRQRLLAADAVVYDNLATTALPCDLPAGIALHCVGKQAGHHPVPQEEINAMLVRLAREGKRVVRLKGGDPYVFGRGGEEAEALMTAGVPFEVVPAVTAGVAVPAYAGIPVTHRQEVVRVTLVTAHESSKEGGGQVRWDLLGGDPHATLIGYMGVTSLPQVVRQLLAAGLSPTTPAAMIERGTTPRQKVVRATLAELPDAVSSAGLRPPGLFIIGPSVRHAGSLDWFSRRPLFGQRLLMVSPAGEVGESLEFAGAQIVEVPLPVTEAARVVMGAHPLTGCVLRSVDELEALDEERDTPTWGSRVKAWCLGKEVAQRARQLGWTSVQDVGQDASAAELVAWLKEGKPDRTPYSKPGIQSGRRA